MDCSWIVHGLLMLPGMAVDHLPLLSRTRDKLSSLHMASRRKSYGHPVPERYPDCGLLGYLLIA